MPAHAFSRALIAGFFALIALAISLDGGAQTTPRNRPGRPALAIKEATTQLAQEARQLRREQRPPPDIPDFATRFTRELPPADLQAAICTPCASDSFVDAYIRWQLTSFNPELPELDDEQFLNLLRGLPALAPSPRGAVNVVARFREVDTKQFSGEQLRQIRNDAAELDHRTLAIAAMNGPAQSLREWLSQKLGVTNPRRLQFLLERCAVDAAGCWPLRSIKTRMSKEFKAAAGDAAFTSQQREAVAQQTRRLAGTDCVAVNEVTILADGTVNVTFTRASVDDDDVANWLANLLPQARAQ